MNANRWVWMAAVAAMLMLWAPRAHAQAEAPNYANAPTWVCRPGKDTICTTGLDAVIFDASGNRTPQPFVAAKNPPIDCFYVYPTVSREQTDYADLKITPEIERVTREQVGRLSSRCRVFAPVYRQATLMQLRNHMAGGQVKAAPPGEREQWPADDVATAWAYYLAHDNNGRGVVLIGHSQGTIILQNLIRTQIDGKPVQKLLVSAFLGGDPSLSVKPGSRVGGTFKNISTCATASETGCVYAWGSYFEGNTTDNPIFGREREDGMNSACDNPAAPGGGKGQLKSYFPKPSMAPADDPPFIEEIGQLEGGCERMHGANGFNVHVLEGTFKALNEEFLQQSQRLPGWGLHTRDMALVQGNILDVIDAELATWSARR